MASVSIVIPTWNGRRLLEEFLPSVIEAASVYAEHASSSSEIVIVDDGSTDDTLGWLADEVADTPVPIRTIRHETNLGFGEACNRGVREAAHDLVFLVNNDVDVGRDAIAPLVTRFRQWRGEMPLFAVHCRVIDLSTSKEVGAGKMGGFARGFLRVHRSYVPREPVTGPLYSMFASGGSSMFDRRSFLDLGGFDPLFAPFYLEDVELSYRAWKRGFAVCYEPTSAVRHRFSSTIGPLAGRRISRVAQRNRLLLHWIHLHDRRFLASHAAWLLVLLGVALPTFRVGFIGAVFDAVLRLPAVRVRRRREKSLARRSDRDVLATFRAMEGRGDVRPYDDPGELD